MFFKILNTDIIQYSLYKVRIPNKEILLAYKETISIWFESAIDTETIQDLLNSLISGRVSVFERGLAAIVRDTFSF